MLWNKRTVLGAVLAAVAAGTLGACNPEPKDVTHLSEERRIWVVRRQQTKDTTVYRCADGAGPDQPPKPVCIRAPFAEQP
jgi:hypothetical protein